MSPSTWFRSIGLCVLLIGLGVVASLWAEETKGKKFALLVGVTEYKGDTFNTLKYTENDVEKLAVILEKAGFSKVRVLTNKRGEKNKADLPTAANVKKAIDELCEDKDKRDTLLVAFSGHGANVSVDDPYEKGKPKTYAFFCPHDASLLGVSYSTGRSKFLINLKLDLFDKLEKCGARSKLVLIDACRNEFKAEAATRSLGLDKETVPGGVSVLFSCSKDEVAWESPKLEHGVFFHFVLEGLRGKAKNEDGEVTWPRLTAYVAEQVERQVPLIIKKGASQTPHTLGNYKGTPVIVPPAKEAVVENKKAFTNSIGMKFVRIAATGEKGFMMGSTEEEREEVRKELKEKEQPAWLKAEGPRHKVILSKDFYLGVTEVTQKQYKAVMDKNPSYFCDDGDGKDKVKGKNTDDFPVEQVSWEDAQSFLDKLNALAAEKKYKVKYRLPTEAEWEYACRGGADVKEPFTFKKPSNSISSAFANFNGKYPFGGGDKGDYLERTSQVGSYKQPNPFGLHDMHGNVYEWCSDWYSEDTYTKETRRDPSGPQKGVYRVFRGGGWFNSGIVCRSAYRFGSTPDYRSSLVGFRVAAVPSE